MVWTLWFQRNQVVFKKVKTDWPLSFIIKMSLGFWLKGWHQNTPFSPGDVVSNLESVCLWRRERSHRPAVSWRPPPPNRLKWNVDGSSKGKLVAAGIGGVLRDEHGTIKAMFSAFVGIRDSNEAEFIAIVYALEMSL